MGVKSDPNKLGKYRLLDGVHRWIVFKAVGVAETVAIIIEDLDGTGREILIAKILDTMYLILFIRGRWFRDLTFYETIKIDKKGRANTNPAFSWGPAQILLFSQPCLALAPLGPLHISIMEFIIFFPMAEQSMEPSWLPQHLLIISA
ncbi:MAG: hypothetical protein MUO68_07700, partial [Desulfobacteraceae bacterium]|nr:hypothetical protein [Desulfobacteraceae bacterium]